MLATAAHSAERAVLVTSSLLAEAPALPYAGRIHQLQSAWGQAP